MGIINVTPDSFYASETTVDAAVARAEALVDQGVDVLDIGGESTRPGAVPVDPEDEWKRVEPVLRALRNAPVPLSIDTRRGLVAERALAEGADWVNDVSGGQDAGLLSAVADAEAAYILMHMRGVPETMQQLGGYDDVVQDVIRELRQSVHRAIKAGVCRERIVVDPGVGFAKGADDSRSLMRNLRVVGAELGLPLLLGASRKSWMGHLLGHPPDDRLEGSLAAAAAAHVAGAAFVRVHDVAETVRFLDAAAVTLGPISVPCSGGLP